MLFRHKDEPQGDDFIEGEEYDAYNNDGLSGLIEYEDDDAQAKREAQNAANDTTGE